MTKPLNIGLVGYGLNSVEQKNELERHPLLKGSTKLIVGYDPDTNAQERLHTLESIKVAKSFEDLLDTEGLEAVLINSPPQFHAEQAVAALESGLHVFSEIPMAIKDKDLERIISAEEVSHKTYQLGENYCFIPEVIYAAHLVSSGKIGKIVYAESEYLHDVTYRWRQGGYGDITTPRIDSWYQLFDPLMYAHTIGPAQVAMGGLESPIPFVEVVSYSNDLGGHDKEPICYPAKAFQVALFKAESGAIAKCANAYVIAREPPRLTLQVIGSLGTYESYQFGLPGYLFLADNHKISSSRHRKGKKRKVDLETISEIVPSVQGDHFGADVRVLKDWLLAITKEKRSTFSAKIGANFCIAGIAASKSARSNAKSIAIKNYIN
jgi:predicted dehydrogenase